MNLYRGQARGAAVGEWWTTLREEAVTIARSRHSEWEVLTFDPDDAWTDEFLEFDRRHPESQEGDWYKIPLDRLPEQARALSICAGHVRL